MSFNGNRWQRWVSSRWTVCGQSACSSRILPSASQRTWSTRRASRAWMGCLIEPPRCRRRTGTWKTGGSWSEFARQSSETERGSCLGLRRSWRTSGYCHLSAQNKGQRSGTCYSAACIESDSCPEALYNLAIGSWLAWDDDTATSIAR